MKRSAPLTLLIVLLALGWSLGCGGGGGTVGDGSPAAGQKGALNLRVSTGPTPAVRVQGDQVFLQVSQPTVRLEIALRDGAGSPVIPVVTVERDPQQGVQTVVLREIPPGNWLLDIASFNSSGVRLAAFQQHVAVRAGETSSIVASLTPIASPSPSPTVPPTPVARTLAVSLRGSPDVALIDVATGAVTRLPNIATDDGGSPDLLRSIPHDALYVLDDTGDSGNKLQVYDTVANTVRATLTLGSGSSSPYDLAMLPDASKLFVSVHFDDKVAVIDPATDTVTGLIDVGAAGVADPHGMALSPDGSKLYVASNANNKNAAVIDTATETVVAVITAIPNTGSRGPRDVAVSPDGSEIWFSDPRGNQLSAYDASTLTHLGDVVVQGTDGQSAPRQMAFTPDGTKLVVTLSASTDLAVVDRAGRTQVAAIPIVTSSVPSGNPMHLAMDSAGRFVFVTHPASDQVLTVDLLQESVFDSTSLPGETPTGILVYD